MGGLTLLAPKGLWLAALAAPLLVLYVLRVRRQRRVVPSVWLYAAARRDLAAAHPFQRLRSQVPLFVELLSLALLALALARPALRGPALLGEHLAIVIDASASMLAEARSPSGERVTRLELAREAARALLSGLGPGADVLVVEAALEPRVVVPLERDVPRAAALLDAVRAHEVEGDLTSSVALAIDRLRPLGGSSRVVVLTDGALARPLGIESSTVPVDLLTVGDAAENAGIVRLDVRSGPDPVTRAERLEALAVVGNFGAAPRELFVTMREHNASDVLASRKVLVPAGEKLPVVLSFSPTRGDYGRGLVFELSPHDALAADDVAFARVPAGESLQVVLSPVATASPWLTRVFASDPAVELSEVPASALTTAKVDADALVVAEGSCPVDAPGGDLLVVGPPEGRCFGVSVGAAASLPALTSWDDTDPRLRFLTLDGVTVREARLLTPESQRQSLVRASQGVLVADGSTSVRTVTVVGFDVGDSNWPLRASFVLFARNVTELARAHRAASAGVGTRTGEPLRVPVPRTARDLEIVGPIASDGGAPPRVDASLREGVAVAPHVSRAGLYQASWKGERAGSLLVPVNLTSAAESDLRGKPIAGLAGGRAASATQTDSSVHELGWLLALVGLGLVLFDVWWLTRAPRVGRAVGA